MTACACGKQGWSRKQAGKQRERAVKQLQQRGVSPMSAVLVRQCPTNSGLYHVLIYPVDSK